MVAPSRRWSLLISPRVETRSAASRLDSGSSSRKHSWRRTAQRVRLAIEQAGESERFGHRLHPAFDLRTLDRSASQSEGQIVLYAHVWVERIGLQYNGDA